jgi:two-component system NarL family sensor kinase
MYQDKTIIAIVDDHPVVIDKPAYRENLPGDHFYHISMKRFICFVFFCLGIAVRVYAQPPIPLNGERYLDSLGVIINSHATDSNKARANFALSYYWSDLDTAKSWRYLIKGRALSGNRPYLQSIGYYFFGNYYFDHNKPQAKIMYMKADSLLSRFRRPEAYRFRAAAYKSYAALIQREDNEKQYINLLFKKCIPLAQQSGDDGLIGLCYSGIAGIFVNNRQFNKATEYLYKAIPLLKRPRYQSGLADAYISLAKNYLLQEKPVLAKPMLDSAKAIMSPYPTFSYWVDYYSSEGMYFRKIKKHENAIQSLDKGIALANELRKYYEMGELNVQKYHIYMAQKQYKKAADVMLYNIQNPVIKYTNNRLGQFYDLSEAYKELEDFPNAYKWLSKSLVLLDSMYDARMLTDVSELEAKYRAAEKQKKIVELEAGRQKATFTNWLLGSASITLLIVTLFLIYYYRSNRKLAKQKELNYQQQLKEAEQQQKLSFAEALLTGEERERQRVARDLHDGLGGMLSGIKIKLSGQARAGADQNLDGVILQLDHSVSELRRIARNMMPESLLKLGLETALLDLCELLMSDQTQISFQAYDIRKDMPAIIQANIYRIVQETLTNAVRHAQASKIILQCSQNGNTFLITIEDNGTGFDAEAALKAEGMGFSNIKSRVDYLKGKMDIESAINEGTSINIELDVSG